MPVGDIVWVEYPAANGHEQAGRRPSLVLQDDGFAMNSPLVITIPFTTAASTVARFPAVIPVVASGQNGLARDSFLLVFQIRAIDRRRVSEPIGSIDHAVLSQVYLALDLLTGRSDPPSFEPSDSSPQRLMPRGRTLTI